MFLYDFATKTAQKPDTVATYIRRNEKIFKNHVERREKQLWLDEKAVKILLKKYPEVQRKKYPWWKNETEFEEAMVKAIKGLWDNQEILRKELDGILTAIAELQDAMDQKEPQGDDGHMDSPSLLAIFLFDDKFDTGYFSTSFNRIKFNSYIGQFVDF